MREALDENASDAFRAPGLPRRPAPRARSLLTEGALVRVFGDIGDGHAIAGKDRHTLDDVLELADVPRPLRATSDVITLSSMGFGLMPFCPGRGAPWSSSDWVGVPLGTGTLSDDRRETRVPSSPLRRRSR